MKKIAMYLLLAFAFITNAQEPSNPAAKAQYKTYKGAIDKLGTIDPIEKLAAYKNQISQAEAALKNIKKYEPGYDVSSLEAELLKHKTIVGDAPKDEKAMDFAKLNAEVKKMKTENTGCAQVQFYLDLYKNKYPEAELAPYKKAVEDYKANESSKAAEQNQQKSNLKSFEEEFKKVFIRDRYDLETDNDEKIPVIESNLVTYKKNLEAFLTPDNIAKASKTEETPSNNLYKRALEEGLTAKSLIKDISKDNASTYFTRQVRAVSNYCKLQSFKIKFECYKKLFSEKAEMVALSNEITSLVTAEGAKEQLISKANKNNAEAVKARRMKPAVRTDAAIESEIKNALKDKEGTIVKINLLDKEWRVVRNELTGIATQRAQDFHLVMNKNGKCTLYDLILREDFDGTKYLQGYVTGYGTGWEIVCENVK